MIKIICRLVIILSSVGIAAVAKAGLITTPLQTKTYSFNQDASIPSVSAPLEFAQFDSTLGSLFSVEVVVDYEAVMTVSMMGTHDPLGAFSQFHHAQIFSEFSSDELSLGLDRGVFAAAGTQLGCTTYTDGPSTCTNQADGSNLNNTGYVFNVVDSNYLSAWIGASTVTVTPTADWVSNFNIDGMASDFGSYVEWQETFVSVQYTYSDSGPGTPVPEPPSLALFGLGLAGLGWLRRKKETVAK